MKKLTLTMMLLLTLAMPAELAAQKHRHTPQAAQVQQPADSADEDAIVAYSDTTSAPATANTATTPFDDDWTDDDGSMGSALFDHFMMNLDASDLMGMAFALLVLLIIFVLAPVLIIIALFYFINKNRKQRMRLAQMAMQQGQPIPQQLLEERQPSIEDEYQKGMRQCFVGVGLMIFLYYAAGQVGFGVGALVFCIGLGKVFAARSRRKDTVGDDGNAD
jgi:hypothetical protein